MTTKKKENPENGNPFSADNQFIGGFPPMMRIIKNELSVDSTYYKDSNIPNYKFIVWVSTSQKCVPADLVRVTNDGNDFVIFEKLFLS